MDQATVYGNLLATHEVAIVNWHHARNLIDGSDSATQLVKLREEVEELAEDILAGKDIQDEAGDVIIVLINLLERDGHTLLGALRTAYDKIKDRKGEMRDGIFVKEEDL